MAKWNVYLNTGAVVQLEAHIFTLKEVAENEQGPFARGHFLVFSNEIGASIAWFDSAAVIGVTG